MRLDYRTKVFRMLKNNEITFAEYGTMIEKHEQKLEKRRKYRQGEAIASIDELLQQEFVCVFGGIKHIEFVKSLQFRTILDLIERKHIWEAIKKADKEVKQ